MRLLRAEFTNFRLLRDLILDFPTGTDKRLTVIRAENESGKTTILNGLQWALYGDDALAARRREYRMHPIDWDTSEGNRVPIVVEVDFETKAVRHSPTHGRIESTQSYRIIRSTYDVVREDGWQPGPTSVRLFELTERGSVQIDPPEARIREELPEELREIFFTDGDRALSFIEADVSASTKQDRVLRAIRSLLGLEVIEGALGRIKRAASEVNKQVKDTVPHHQLANVAGELTELGEEQERIEQRIRDADQQFVSFDERYAAIEKQIEDLLTKGNRDDLSREIGQTRRRIKQLDAELTSANRQHSSLFRSLALSRELMAPVVESSLAKLDELRDQGKIPNSTIPVLEERLGASTCFCGEPIEGHDPATARRRHHIESLIEMSRKADALQSTITDLYYASRPLQMDQGSREESWSSQYHKVAGHRDSLLSEREQLGRQAKALEARVAQIPDHDIQGLQRTRSSYRDQRDRFNAERTRHRADRDNVRDQHGILQKQYHDLLRQQDKGARFMADLEVAQDIQNVLGRAYERLTTEELAKVSTRMNDIFLEMIGADPSQGAIIQGAKITDQFEITVYGPNGRLLNPDRDLNGASRRALTLAFILALTKVSEVEAPNVIDTPLGMMSGFVKKSVLTTAIRESSQLILFLTRSEIADCEDILDSEAANVITLTNPAHYPVMLVNDPQVHERTVLQCECDHRQECTTCQRVAAPSVELAAAV